MTQYSLLSREMIVFRPSIATLDGSVQYGRPVFPRPYVDRMIGSNFSTQTYHPAELSRFLQQQRW